MIQVRGWLLAGLLLALTACGGGDGSSDSAPAPGGASSSVSSATSSNSSVASSASSTSSASSSVATAFVCPATGLYFCDDFAAGDTNKWDLLSATANTSGPNGAFGVIPDSSNNVLQFTAASTGGVLALVKPTAFTGVTSPDYYVEARIRPRNNSTTGNKFLYLIARYQDANNWYGGGLNVQGSTGSTQVEVAKSTAGSISRPVQGKRAIIQGTAGLLDGQWYTVRFELIGTALTVYLDGEKIGTTTDAGFTSKGLIGLYTANKSFEIDDVKVGDPSVKPVQLTLAPSTLTYAAEAGDAPYAVTITATKNDGVTADTFTAVSSNPAIVTATTAGNVVTITPVGAGTATVTFTSGSDATVKRVITATISPAFVQPTQTYTLTGKASPAAGDAAAYIDANLQLTFDSPPTLGTAGSIRIFKKSDDSLVDVIKVAAETDTIGYTAQTAKRVVNTTPIRISGNTVTISPHNNILAYGTRYYVAIANGVFTGANLGGTPFVGIGKAGNWSFTTKADPGTALTTLTVDDDGSTANFRTVQGALNYVMQNVAAATPATINVKNGTYEELLFLRGKNNVTIQGESRSGVVIQYKNLEALNSGSGASQAPGSGTPAGGRAVLFVETSDLLTLDTLTLKNTTLRSALSSQAETIYFKGRSTAAAPVAADDRLVAKNVDFFSEQDTIQVQGYSWFYNCLIAGNVDFIWGANRVALFENSEIRSVGDTTNATSGGYLVQARSVLAADKGFVFLNSKLTHGVGPGPSAGDVPTGANAATWLARSPGGATTWDNVVFVNTKMDTHITAAGWAGAGVLGQPAPNPAVPTAVSGWREYGSMTLAGAALDVSARVGGYPLNSGDYSSGFSTRAQIFSAYNASAGWNPAP
ncbi:MAG TPA: pectinesterase family protein [Rhodocyclaceae bacterium]|nr:pectinesterase family protein [Rhodocyclaceae bacterium]